MVAHVAQFAELSEGQLRQYIDAETVLHATLAARAAAQKLRGSMLWRSVAGQDYLIRTSASARQKSLGPRTPATQDMYDKFMAQKVAAKSRLKELESQLKTHQRLCRALRVGRTPQVVVAILNVLVDAGLSQHFLVVGTHALFAYESAAGVRIHEQAMATQDVDLLFDTRQRLAFELAIDKSKSSLLGLLRKADPSFELVEGERCTVRNNKGFEVDVVRRVARDGDPHPMRMSTDEDDIWPVQISMGQHLLSARRFSQMVVATSGEMAMMHTVHPLDFARIKQRLAKSAQRNPLKVSKDKLQAKIVTQLVKERLPQLA